MTLEPFLIRLLVGVLVIWLFEKLLAVVAISVQAKELLNIIIIIAVVLFVVFGAVLLR